MSRIGVYGGSFNPPHCGHVLAAAESVQRLSLDRLLVIPTYLSPHKPQPEGSPSPALRLELTRRAFAGLAWAEVSELEILREGVSYTVDTLRTLKEQFPNDELVLLMGTDMLLSFPTWREPAQIAGLATLAVMHRQNMSERLRAQCSEMAQRIERDFGGRVLFAENRCLEVSSTEVRRMIAFGAADYQTPAAVAELIAAKGLYGYGADRTRLPFARLKEVSLRLHDEKRRAHVCGCSETAERLAQKWDADPVAAARAGMLHDITKALSASAQLAICDLLGVALTDFERANPKLLHAKTGAAVAAQVFGESEAVCEAIRWHTTGRASMALLEKILYLADYMEPNRDFAGVERLRTLAEADLDAALLEGLTMSIEILKRRGQPIDENSMAAWQYLANERSKTT